MMEKADRFRSEYSTKKRIAYAIGAILFAILVAGFWNYHLVDGFGQNIIAGNTIGDTGELANEYDAKGGSFGLLFAAIAGLAATFTACNCVVFAMIPGLACSTEQAERSVSPWKIFASFTTGVLIVSGAYGIYVGYLGGGGIKMLNERPVRLAQAQAVFTMLGLIMLIWGGLELGFFDRLKKQFTETTRNFFDQTTTKAFLLGSLVGLFAVGRPFPVFREFLVYAASAQNPIYGALVMMIQGIGQIAVMALLFFLIVWAANDRLGKIAMEKQHKLQMVSGLALIAGGTYFIYYWGLAFLFDIGRWGFKLGWYG